MVSLNLLKHMGSHFNYSVLVPMFHKVSYQGEFSMLRKGPKVQGAALTVLSPCPEPRTPGQPHGPAPETPQQGQSPAPHSPAQASPFPGGAQYPALGLSWSPVGALLLSGVVGEALTARPCHFPPGEMLFPASQQFMVLLQ